MKKAILLQILASLVLSSSAFGFSIACNYPCYVKDGDIMTIIKPRPRPLGFMTEADMARVKAICEAINGELLKPECPQPPPGAR